MNKQENVLFKDQIRSQALNPAINLTRFDTFKQRVIHGREGS